MGRQHRPGNDPEQQGSVSVPFTPTHPAGCGSDVAHLGHKYKKHVYPGIQT